MAVPKRRKSRAKTRKGRANKAMTQPHVIYCPSCGGAALPHCVCPQCGFYQGRTMVEKED